MLRRAPWRRRTGAAAVAVLCAVPGSAVVAWAPAAAQPPAAPDSTPPAVETTVAYTGALVTDAAGGARRGTVGLGTGAVQLTVRLQQLVGWRGARVFVFVLGTHGGAPSDVVGDLQGVSNLQAVPAVRLEEAWLQQNFVANRVSVLAGRVDLNAEFYRLQSSGLFSNSALGTGPEFAGSGATGPSIYPRTTPGGRVQVKPSRGTVVRLAVVSHGRAAAGPAVAAPSPPSRTPSAGGGALLVGEAALLARPDTGDLPRDRRFRVGRSLMGAYAGKLAVGAWYYTARYPDLADTLAGGAPVPRRGSRGVYIIGDQTVWSAPHGGPGALNVFAQLGVGDARVDQIGGSASGGVTRVAPVPGRPGDEVGVAVTAAFVGAHARRAATAGTLGGAETTLEATYQARLASWLVVQPDVQYVVHPSARRAVRNAWVPGLRFVASR